MRRRTTSSGEISTSLDDVEEDVSDDMFIIACTRWRAENDAVM